MFSLARVVEIHPESHSVDIEMMEDGRRMPGVQVIGEMCGTDFGKSDMAVPAKVGYTDSTANQNTGVRDIYAVVGFIGRMPVVAGFLFPQVAEVLFADREFKVSRHASDVYHTIDKDGNVEFYHPSGTYIRIGESAAHVDLTGQDYDQKWKIKRNTGKAVHVHLSVANAGSEVAALDISPAGNVTLSCDGNLSATVGGTTAVASTGDMTLTAPNITLNGNTVVNGALTQGLGAAGGACTMLGPVTVTNDLSAGGKSIVNHTHTDSMGGTTTPPN